MNRTATSDPCCSDRDPLYSAAWIQPGSVLQWGVCTECGGIGFKRLNGWIHFHALGPALVELAHEHPDLYDDLSRISEMIIRARTEIHPVDLPRFRIADDPFRDRQPNVQRRRPFVSFLRRLASLLHRVGVTRPRTKTARAGSHGRAAR